MLNLAEKYWAWRNRKPECFKTEQGYEVKHFVSRGGWAVKGTRKDRYFDLTGDHQWPVSDYWFKDCLADRETIERRFGKILDEGYENNP